MPDLFSGPAISDDDIPDEAMMDWFNQAVVYSDLVVTRSTAMSLLMDECRDWSKMAIITSLEHYDPPFDSPIIGETEAYQALCERRQPVFANPGRDV